MSIQNSKTLIYGEQTFTVSPLHQCSSSCIICLVEIWFLKGFTVAILYTVACRVDPHFVLPLLIIILLLSCRSLEEVAGLKRKLEKYKSREWMASSDEVLLEEIKTYKVSFSPNTHKLHPPPPHRLTSLSSFSTPMSHLHIVLNTYMYTTHTQSLSLLVSHPLLLTHTFNFSHVYISLPLHSRPTIFLLHLFVTLYHLHLLCPHLLQTPHTFF